MRVYVFCVFPCHLASPRLAPPLLPFSPLSSFLLAPASFPLACFLSPPLASSVYVYAYYYVCARVCVCACTCACVCVIASSLVTSPRLASPRPSSPPLLSCLLPPPLASHLLASPLLSPLPSPPCCGDKCQICTIADIRCNVINLCYYTCNPRLPTTTATRSKLNLRMHTYTCIPTPMHTHTHTHCKRTEVRRRHSGGWHRGVR